MINLLRSTGHLLFLCTSILVPALASEADTLHPPFGLCPDEPLFVDIPTPSCTFGYFPWLSSVGQCGFLGAWRRSSDRGGTVRGLFRGRDDGRCLWCHPYQWRSEWSCGSWEDIACRRNWSCEAARKAYHFSRLLAIFLPSDCGIRLLYSAQSNSCGRYTSISDSHWISFGTITSLEIFQASWPNEKGEAGKCRKAKTVVYLVWNYCIDVPTGPGSQYAVSAHHGCWLCSLGC